MVHLWKGRAVLGPSEEVEAKPILELLGCLVSSRTSATSETVIVLPVALIPLGQSQWTDTRNIRIVPAADGDSMIPAFQMFHLNLHRDLEQFVSRPPGASLATATILIRV